MKTGDKIWVRTLDYTKINEKGLATVGEWTEAKIEKIMGQSLRIEGYPNHSFVLVVGETSRPNECRWVGKNKKTKTYDLGATLEKF